MIKVELTEAEASALIHACVSQADWSNRQDAQDAQDAVAKINAVLAERQEAFRNALDDLQHPDRYKW